VVGGIAAMAVLLVVAVGGPAEAASGLGKPTATGSLRIAGTLRDGGVVSTRGLTWHPIALPHGDKLLSFGVTRTWRACSKATGKCVPAADQTATPFAAKRYIVGHADTGRRLRLTETATEVVETDPANFGFKVIRASVSVTTSAAVKPFAAGRAPTSNFVNGVPEQRTGSNQEQFQVSPAHYAAANGVPKVEYRVDAKAWTPLPANHVFATGKLALGHHLVRVRTSNRAGTTLRGFGWRVVALPQPAACTRSGGCWYPQHLDSTGHPMRWDWQIGRVTPLQRTGAHAVDIYDIDGFLTTPAEIHDIHTKWQANTLAHPGAVCYLDLAWENYRPDANRFPNDTLGKVYYGYANERWVDFRQLNALKPMLQERIGMCAAKGFDAVELDDIDSFDPASTTGFHLTIGDAQNYLAYADNLIHQHGMTVMWKNSPLLSSWGRRYTDGAVVEECYVYNECFSANLAGTSHLGVTCTGVNGATPCGWDDFTTDTTANQPTGKWVGEIEYGDDQFVCNPGKACPGRKSYAAYCNAVYAPSYGFAAAKLDVDLDGKVFFPCPNGR
jgi:hypothetical protein